MTFYQLQRYVGSLMPALLAAALLSIAVVDMRVEAQISDSTPDPAMYARIREEAQAHWRVMDFATELIDGIGARLTGSPNLKKALEWASARLMEMGLSQVRTESWGEFGVGWEQRNVWARMIAPDTATIIAYAAPWSPPTRGPVTAEVVSVSGSCGAGRCAERADTRPASRAQPCVAQDKRPLLISEQLVEQAKPT